MDLAGQVAIVTGGVGGIGGGMVRTFLKKGCKVCIVDVVEEDGIADEKSLTREYGAGRVIYCNCDVTKRANIEGAFDKAAEKLGPVRIICNNAGIFDDVVNPSRMVEVNLTGVILGTTVAIERMRKDKGGPGGVVVNTSSMAGIYPYWFFPAYSGTKAGIVNFTRSWSLNPNQKDMGVRFNTLCPSTVRTPRQNHLDGKLLDMDAVAKLNKSEGFLEVEEVAELVCRLVTEDLNGAVVTISKRDGIEFHDLPVKKLY